LNEKVEKCKDLKIEYEKIQKIAEEIEIAMFGKYRTVNILIKGLIFTTAESSILL
jgi:hypothetical protein